MLNTPIRLLLIGHVCHDLKKEEYVLGGTASYVSLLAKQLGAECTILTSYGKDFLFEDFLKNEGIKLVNSSSHKTTVFKNVYHKNERQQFLSARAANILSKDLNELSSNFDIVLYCPIADEVAPEVLQYTIPNTFKAATIQGFMRSWDVSQKVSFKIFDFNILCNLDLLILSEEDIQYDRKILRSILEVVDHVVVTKAANGADIYYFGDKITIPAILVKAKEVTGAGDSFAAAYIFSYYKHHNLILAGRYANAVASLMIEEEGVYAYKTINSKKIEERMKLYG